MPTMNAPPTRKAALISVAELCEHGGVLGQHGAEVGELGPFGRRARSIR